MNTIPLLLFVLLLSACEKPMPFESAEALLANPERLKELQRECKYNWEKTGNAQCNAAVEAERTRFIGKGTPYTSHPVKGF